jgi:hypothetical protein
VDATELAGNPKQRWLVSVGSVILCGLLFGIVVGLFGSLESGSAFSLPVALVLSLGGGLAFGLAGYGDEIWPITGLRWSWATLCDGLFSKLLAAAGVGLLLSAGVALVLDGALGATVGAAAALAFCYFGGLDFELIKTDDRHRTVPNEGMWRSLCHALLGGLVGALTGAVAGGLVGGLLGGSVFGLVIALLVGGYTCLQHLILRTFLWRNGVAPWDYVRFLEYAVERIFLHRVGGGYIFVHRSLLEYFARQYSATPKRPS